MKKSVLFLTGLFLLGILTGKAQDMTPKEKSGYAGGVLLAKKIKSEGLEFIFEDLKEGGFLEALRAGFQDALKGEVKLSEEEIMSSLESFQQKMEAMQNKNKEKESEKESQDVSKNTIDYQSSLARNYCNISWDYLFIKDFDQSEQAARKALELDSSYILSKTNLAHALLFQNHFSEAEAIYKELLQTDESYTQILLNDFNDLEKSAGIPDECKKNVEKIRQILWK